MVHCKVCFDPVQKIIAYIYVTDVIEVDYLVGESFGIPLQK